MDEPLPLVSIGLPVFNGEAFIREALDSILAQTYLNIEVIVTDNASEDSTPSIIAEYVARDKRVKFFPSEVNRGAAWNYNRSFEKATGMYFKWAAHDDVLDSRYIESCVAELESDTKIVLCHSRTGQIDGTGAVQPHEYVRKADMLDQQLSIAARYKTLITARGSWTRIFGVIRSDVLGKTPLIDSYTGSDLTLLGELGLYGRVVDLPDILFWRREHAKTSTRGAYNARRNRLVWFSSRKNPIANFPEWRLNLELMRSIFRTRVIHERTYHCVAAVMHRVWKKKKLILQDILFAASDIFIAFTKKLTVKFKALILRSPSPLS